MQKYLSLFTLPSLLCILFSPVVAESPAETTVISYGDKFLWTYGSWKDGMTVSDGKALIKGTNGKGCGGHNIEATDLSGYLAHSPVLDLVINEGTSAKKLLVSFKDQDGGEAAFWFKLEGQPRGEDLNLEPMEGTSIGTPAQGKELDPTRVTQVNVLGDWQNGAVDLAISAVRLVEPSPEVLELRKELTAKKAAEAEAQRKKVQAARDNIQHLESSPEVIRAYSVGRNILAVEIMQGVLHPSAIKPYVPQEGDEIESSGKYDGVEVEQGGEIEIGSVERTLSRIVDGKRKKVGYIGGGRKDASDLYLWEFEEVTGDKLEILTVQDPTTYRIRTETDVLQPVAVHRKSKSMNRAQISNEQTVRHIVYLVLPEDLKEGETYTIDFVYLNTNVPSMEVTHDTRSVRSEAIHTSHIGYAPSDPYKRAFLSLWMGDKRAHTYEDYKEFELLDEAGKTVYTGKIEEVLAVDGIEKVRPNMNLSQTAVYALDFSSFDQLGTYLVHVPGIGVSYPVEISDKVWENAFQLSMHGFLSQRNGIKLGPPFTTFERGRSMHPDDGVVVYQSTTTGEEANDKSKYKDWFVGLQAGRTDEVVEGAWGGYNDAGDYDRASNHLWATYLHLELLELYPDYFEKVKLALPPEEANDDLPDILNEALWNASLFYRLQKEDGGVGAGIESSQHPRKGEDSVIDSLVLMSFAPSAEPTYVFAATAAKVARVSEKYDETLSADYAAAAIKAFDWAEKQEDPEGKAYMGINLEDARNVAAAELLMLTGDAKYDTAFKESNTWKKGVNNTDSQGGGFTYLRLPEDVGDPEIKALLREALIAQADAALAYAEGNAFGLTSEFTDMPLIGPVGAFTTPGMKSRILPRAHYITGEEKYLAGTIRSCNFAAGANPDNRAMTTGLGYHPPIAPLHFDSRLTGQPPPAGLTLYGAFEPKSLPSFSKGQDWVHTWIFPKTIYPSSRSWPSTEFYVDSFLWPLMNEMTIRQNMGPTSYTWGYLAAVEAE